MPTMQELESKYNAKCIECECLWLQGEISSEILRHSKLEHASKEREWEQIGEQMIQRYDELEQTTRELKEKDVPPLPDTHLKKMAKAQVGTS